MKARPLSLKARALLVRRKPHRCLATELVPSRALLDGTSNSPRPSLRLTRRFGNGGAQQGSDARSSGLTFI